MPRAQRPSNHVKLLAHGRCHGTDFLPFQELIRRVALDPFSLTSSSTTGDYAPTRYPTTSTPKVQGTHHSRGVGRAPHYFTPTWNRLCFTI